MICKGRKKISTEITDDMIISDINSLVSLLNVSMETHKYNKADIDYLINYRNGEQTILTKVKKVRDEINNKVVMNHAQMITRVIGGYFLGNPIQYIQAGDGAKKEDIDRLNRYVSFEDKPSVDKEIGELQSICGTAYRIVYTDGAYSDEVPFEEKSLDPSCTFVVYENNISEQPLLGVTYHNMIDEDGVYYGNRIYVYTRHGLYTFESDKESMITKEDLVEFVQYNVGGVPIIEYPNNRWRIGDWELCIGLMDAINSLDSGRLDDIDQIIQSLIVFVNADIDSTRYDEMRERGIVMLNNTTQSGSSVDTISTPLDHSGMNMFAKELSDLLYALIGIPSRDNRSGGGGDTGQAVELRDGWADLEILARNKELEFKKSEKRALKIILTIMNNKEGTKLSLLDIDIKFSRNKSNNLLVKTQGYMNLLGTKTLAPADCLTIVDLVSDVNEYISRGESFWGEQFANKHLGEKQNENENVTDVKLDEKPIKDKMNKNSDKKETKRV